MLVLLENEWLSTQVGKQVYDLDVSNPEIYESKFIPYKNSLIVAKVPSANMKLVNHLCGVGFKLVDTNVQYIRDLSPLNYSGHGIRVATPIDEISVVEIAKTSFFYDRFHNDENISPEVASKIKSKWASNYFRGLRGDLMIVAEIKGQVAGFLQMLEMPENSVCVDLIAVMKDHRGAGLAGNMIGFAIEFYKKKKSLIVGTQLINTSSITLYQKIGFLYKSSQHILHYHAKAQ
jgi:GNAT superfamily N-acetyltransferase